jgi:hypothetical protein
MYSKIFLVMQNFSQTYCDQKRLEGIFRTGLLDSIFHILTFFQLIGTPRA